ncbi:MAG: PAS domain S-box protein, partial [Candidatus Omnitrophica bacterium]|nr:PAS domain S-box protein [Candidatus Omnitrophota bacterium]
MKWIRPEITKEVLDKWKEGLDLISNLVNIPAGLIMKTYPLEVEVLISSATLNNPYKTGQKFNLDTGLYCESIIAQHTLLIITNARKDPRWAQSPDVSLGMVSFFGLPLMWPDGEMFGVICLLDKKERNFSSSTQKIFLLFKKSIDSDLDLLLKMGEHKRSKNGLERLKEELELRVDARTEELKKLNQQMQIEISERRETEKKYRDLVEKEKDVIFTLDSEGICTWVSPKIHDLLGYNPEELLNKKFLSIIPEEWHEKTKADFDKVCQEQELTSETVVLNKQGERKFIEFSATTIKEGNKILGIRGIARDITERKRVEEQIRESSERLKYILDSIPAGIVIIKPDTFSIVDINPLALEMINTSKNKIIGAGCRDFLCPQDEGCCPVKDHNKKIFNQPCFLKKADGSKIPILKTTVPISLKGKEYLLEIFIDVTEQKKAEKALAASEAKYRNLIENSIEGIGIIKDGFYIYANNALLEIFGHSSLDEFIKIPPVETLSPEYRTLFQDRMKKSENGIPVSPVCEYKIIRRNGEIRDVEVSSSKLLIDDQSYYQATFRDVTWRKNWEKALQESEAKYSSLVEQAQEGVVIIQNGVLKFCNKAMSKITGYSLNELIGMDYLYTIVPEYREIIKSKYEEDISQATTPGIFEIKNRRKDGTIIDIELTDSRIYYYDKPAAMCVLRDITERKKSQEALRASEQRFRDISENSLEFIWEIDPKGIYTYASPIIEKILGYKPEELVGKKHYYDFFHPEDRDEIKKITAEIIKENKTFYEFYNRNVHKNGTTVWFSTSGIPMLDKEGKLIGYRGVDMDITQRKKIEKTLEKERQEQQIILDAAPAIIFYKDTENRFIRINKALADATGLAKEKIEGKTCFEVYPGYAEKYWQDDKEVM